MNKPRSLGRKKHTLLEAKDKYFQNKNDRSMQQSKDELMERKDEFKEVKVPAVYFERTNEQRLRD